jgi:hypothetical protein
MFTRSINAGYRNDTGIAACFQDDRGGKTAIVAIWRRRWDE